MTKRPPPEPGTLDVEGPVRWGLSRNFIGGLRNTFLYALFPDRLDPRDWMQADGGALDPPMVSEGEVWLDFFSDSGDSVRATYSLAWALQGDLHARPDAAPGDPVRAEPFEGSAPLPQPHLLVFGGDSAYSVGNLRTIDQRLVAPFEHALAARRGRVPAPDAPMDPIVRVVLAVPQNHDWYDSLDGFNRVFRKPPGGEDPIRRLGEHAPEQTASYFFRRLTPSWQLWGLDTQHDGVDFRQGTHFRDIARASPRPTHRIVVTPTPLVANGVIAKWHDDPALWDRLGIARDGDGGLRLHLAGDVHHYARFEAPTPGATTAIVCGAGGASIDATHVRDPRAATRTATRTWPTADDSRRRQRRLLSPWHMIIENRLGLVAALLGALFGAVFVTREPRLAFTPERIMTLLALIAVAALTWATYAATRRLLVGDEDRARRRAKIIRFVPLVPVLASAVVVAATDLGARIALDLGFYLVVGLVLVGLIALSARAGGRLAPVRAALGLVTALVMLALTAGVVEALDAAGLAGPLSVAIGALASLVGWPPLWGLLVWLTTRLGGHATLSGAFALDDSGATFLRMRVFEDARGAGLDCWVIGVTSVDARALRAARAWSAYPRPEMSLIERFELRP